MGGQGGLGGDDHANAVLGMRCEIAHLSNQRPATDNDRGMKPFREGTCINVQRPARDVVRDLSVHIRRFRLDIFLQCLERGVLHLLEAEAAIDLQQAQ